MTRRTPFAALLRTHRDRQKLSARALSLKAELGPNYVHNVELGRWTPRPHAVRKLAHALELSDIETMEFYQAAGIQADFPSFALLGRESWKHLPGALSAIKHDEYTPSVGASGDVLVDSVRAFSAVLSWIALTFKPPTAAQRRRLRDIAQQAFDKSIDQARHNAATFPNWGPRPAASEAASVLPAAWQDQLFSTQRTAQRLTRMLAYWSYSPRRQHRPAWLGARFTDPRLDAVYGFGCVPPDLVRETHESMVAHRLGADLDLASLLGAEAQSVQAFDLHFRCLEALKTVLAAPDDVARECWTLPSADCSPEQLQQIARTAAAVAQIDFALRLFQIPKLAETVLQQPRDQTVHAVLTAGKLFGTATPRAADAALSSAAASPP